MSLSARLVRPIAARVGPSRIVRFASSHEPQQANHPNPIGAGASGPQEKLQAGVRKDPGVIPLALIVMGVGMTAGYFVVNKWNNSKDRDHPTDPLKRVKPQDLPAKNVQTGFSSNVGAGEGTKTVPVPR